MVQNWTITYSIIYLSIVVVINNIMMIVVDYYNSSWLYPPIRSWPAPPPPPPKPILMWFSATATSPSAQVHLPYKRKQTNRIPKSIPVTACCIASITCQARNDPIRFQKHMIYHFSNNWHGKKTLCLFSLLLNSDPHPLWYLTALPLKRDSTTGFSTSDFFMIQFFPSPWVHH